MQSDGDVAEKGPFGERIIPGLDRWRADTASHFQRYRFASQFAQAKRVLDAGCGAGYGSRLLAESGAREVVAVDIAEDALALARQQFSHPLVRYVRDDLQSLESQEESRFDLVVALESFEHLHDPRKFLRRAAELMCPDGLLICSTPRGKGKHRKPENPYHIAEYSAEEFAALLSDYFSGTKLMGQHYTAAARAASVLWSNPFARLGRALQCLMGRRIGVPFVSRDLLPTEADLIISEVNYDLAWTLIAVCRGPKMTSSAKA